MTSYDESCVFCRIVHGDLPSRRVYEDDLILAFHDIQPAAPTHVVVVPKGHIASLQALSEDDDAMVARLLRATQTVAEAEGLIDRGYRVITNVGNDGGQTVDHLHFHVLGGRQLGSLG